MPPQRVPPIGGNVVAASFNYYNPVHHMAAQCRHSTGIDKYMKTFKNNQGIKAADSEARLTSKELRSRIIEYISAQKNNTFNHKQVAYAINATGGTYQRVIEATLATLAFDGDLIEVSPGSYKAPARQNVAVGTFVRRSNGKNSVVTDADGETIMVAERNSRHALNGDRVRVSIAARRRGEDPEAQVIEIIESKDQTFIGLLNVHKNYGLLHTDSKFLATDIIIPRNRLKGGQSGDKAIVRITEWPEDSQCPTGEVVDILGREGDNTTEMHAILAEFGLPYTYPRNVEEAAQRIKAGITSDVVAQREDMRDIVTFTIDPKDAKDFDDALSVRRLSNGNIEVGVHIADVTHYVKPDTLLDREAESRATSVYLVDRVVPMLPEHLSNGICSLRPDEDKLTFSCIFEMDADAKVIHSRICRTVTRSNRRFTYEEAQQVIETGDGDYKDEILMLDSLAKQLRAARFANGAVEFERAEVRFEIDETGHPVSVYFKESKDANKLIEEFMLLANRTVATYIGKAHGSKHPKAFVYRVHDMPEPGKLADLSKIARTFGYRLKETGSSREVNRSINKMLEDVKGKGEENFLSTLAIRSMAKAIYTTHNIGHYGLSFDYYTHFTSPIRRYPDMMVHRLLERYMAGGRSVNVDKLEDRCKHSSEQEQLAANAERASIKYKQIEYMADHMGEIYTGTISGVTEWGLYVELNDNMCEGLVPVRDLPGDYYDYDQNNYCLIGRRTKVRYRLGDEVRVQVARCDLRRKQLDFALVSDNGRSDEDILGRTGSVAQLQHDRPHKSGKRAKTRSRDKNSNRH